MHIAAMNVTIVELMRNNCIKNWRNFFCWIGLNIIIIEPSMPDSINCNEKWKRKTNSCMSRLVGSMSETSEQMTEKKVYQLTTRPLQYGFTLGGVLWAHQQSHNPKLDIISPTIKWRKNKYCTVFGWRMFNGFRRLTEKKKNQIWFRQYRNLTEGSGILSNCIGKVDCYYYFYYYYYFLF